MKTRQKIYLTLAVLGIIIFLLIGFGVFPALKEIKKSSESLASAKKELIAFRSQVESLEQFKEIYKTLQPDLDKTQTLFADPEVPIDFIRFLEKSGTNSGVLIDISPLLAKSNPSDPWPSMEFQITFTGPFPNFLKFLEKIESAPYLIEIRNLTVKKLTEQELQSKQIEGSTLSDVGGILSIKAFSR